MDRIFVSGWNGGHLQDRDRPLRITCELIIQSLHDPLDVLFLDSEDYPHPSILGGQRFAEEPLRKVFGTRADDVVGFLQCVDNLNFPANVVPTYLE